VISFSNPKNARFLADEIVQSTGSDWKPSSKRSRMRRPTQSRQQLHFSDLAPRMLPSFRAVAGEMTPYGRALAAARPSNRTRVRCVG
jgi:hypothetical protein